ncbi:class I SAM-dependent methyltransferase [Lacticaseibacillus hegangensis]|uniref:Class I SAM-dependent methyltransferase n=1 Tax=Lacticaseibacillus hegangensis TaxID=2486010 RepID=A0ABW4CVV6_9LACO|nr:class I SAM-dependent methyltransferase [Lacticaseibacillus hegangensis]
MEPYPTMKPAAGDLPTSSNQPLWQVLTKKAPELSGKRVLAIHSGDGAFCRGAINAGAIAVLGVDRDRYAISAARDVASSDRLRYRIMPDRRFDLLTGPYDLVIGPFAYPAEDLRQDTHQLAKLLRPSGEMVLAVTGAADASQVKANLSSLIAVSECFAPSQQPAGTKLFVVVAHRAKITPPAPKRRRNRGL